MGRKRNGSSSAAPRRSHYNTYSSSKSELYTSSGARVKNPEAYAAAGGRAFTKQGNFVFNPGAYASTVRKNSAVRAASKKVETSGTSSYVYSLNLSDGGKYVGKTSDPVKRISDHFSGMGAKATQVRKPMSINHIQACRSDSTASKAESIVYGKMREYYGGDQVRGAGHTNSHGF